jgi:hypothetical protein
METSGTYANVGTRGDEFGDETWGTFHKPDALTRPKRSSEKGVASAEGIQGAQARGIGVPQLLCVNGLAH